MDENITEVVEVLYDLLYRMQDQFESKIASLLRAGDCPAHNSKCPFLRGGICIKEHPNLQYYGDNKIGCWSYDERVSPNHSDT